jgi:predicted MPP superfamily phosphohydrolase
MPAKTRRGGKRFRRRLKLLVLAAAIVVAYGVLVAPRHIGISRFTVPLQGLPSDLDGLRVVQVSDLHAGPFFRAASVRRVVRLANACHPDLVVLTGDFVNYRSMRFFRASAPELARLKAPLGSYACLGNHDHWEDAAGVRAALRNSGVRVLVNENVRVGKGLYLAGVDDLMSGKPDLGRATRGIPKAAAVVLLSHNPTALPLVSGRPWLVLAGHTHGGQIALPFLGPRGTMRLPGIRWLAYWNESLGVRLRGGRTAAVATYKYPAGWYQTGRARLYVSRGIGVNQGMPIRLNCPPEIACFTLRTIGKHGAEAR